MILKESYVSRLSAEKCIIDILEVDDADELTVTGTHPSDVMEGELEGSCKTSFTCCDVIKSQELVLDSIMTGMSLMVEHCEIDGQVCSRCYFAFKNKAAAVHGRR